MTPAQKHIIEEAKKLLESDWQYEIEKQIASEGDHLNTAVAVDLINQLCEASRIVERERCAEIVKSLKRDSKYSTHWQRGYEQAKYEAQQKILSLNQDNV